MTGKWKGENNEGCCPDCVAKCTECLEECFCKSCYNKCCDDCCEYQVTEMEEDKNFYDSRHWFSVLRLMDLHSQVRFKRFSVVNKPLV